MTQIIDQLHFAGCCMHFSIQSENTESTIAKIKENSILDFSRIVSVDGCCILSPQQ